MTDIEIFKKLRKIFEDNFQMDSELIQINTGMNDVPQWSSLSHIFLIDKIELEFNVEFSAKDIEQSININQIINIIKTK